MLTRFVRAESPTLRYIGGHEPPRLCLELNVSNLFWLASIRPSEFRGQLLYGNQLAAYWYTKVTEEIGLPFTTRLSHAVKGSIKGGRSASMLTEIVVDATFLLKEGGIPRSLTIAEAYLTSQSLFGPVVTDIDPVTLTLVDDDAAQREVERFLGHIRGQ